MELKMEVYTPALELAGILEVYQSVIWEEYAFQAGSFSVDSLITPATAALLIPENIIWIGGETAGIIEAVQESVGEAGPYITVKGPLLAGLLDRRILWGRYDLRGAAPTIMRELVNDCAVTPTRGDIGMRKLPGLVLDSAAPTGGEAIRKQKTGGSLLEALREIGEASQTAFGIRFNAQAARMEFWARPGVNRSVKQDAVEPVFYSTELDDVLSSEYAYDAGEYKNVALVAGEGEGAARIYLTVEAGSGGGDVPAETKVAVVVNDGGSASTADRLIKELGKLTIGRQRITAASTTIIVSEAALEVVYRLNSAISVKRYITVNGLPIGAVSDAGDVAAVTIPVTGNVAVDFLRDNPAPPEVQAVDFIPKGDTAAMSTADGARFTAAPASAYDAGAYKSAYTGAEIDAAIKTVRSGGTAAAGVSSFHGRTGAVMPQAGDYTAADVGAATMEQVDAALRAAILDSWEGRY